MMEKSFRHRGRRDDCVSGYCRECARKLSQKKRTAALVKTLRKKTKKVRHCTKPERMAELIRNWNNRITS